MQSGTIRLFVFIAAALICFLFSASTAAQPAESTPFDVVRVFQPEMRRLVGEVHRRSPTFRGLVDELRPTGWLVFIQDGECPVKSALGCLLPFVGTYNGARYLRAIINRRARHGDAVMTTIAHELQHAVEVARDPGVSDAAGIRDLFQRIGRRGESWYAGTTYDTAAARAIESLVWHELGERVRK